jgi:hypothetical protein
LSAQPERVIPHSCKSRFCPTCGKHATDVWANQLLNGLLGVPYHHLIMAIPWQLRILIIMNRRAGLNLLLHAATEAIGQWARDIKAMRMGALIVIHTFIGRLIRHIPDKDFPMIRYAGVFSNRWKQHYLSQARIALNQSVPDDSDEDAQPTWAERQTDYTGIDPLLCPHCDKPLTFVGSLFGFRLDSVP